MFDDLISAKALSENLYNPDWIVLDCRGELSDAQAGPRAFLKSHIPTAQYCHLDLDLSGKVGPKSGRHPLPQPDVFVRKLQSWGVTPKTQVIAYDDKGGAFAARLWWMMNWQGHKAAAVLNGGIQSWMALGYDLETGPATPRAKGDFKGTTKKSMTVSAPYIMAHLSDDDLALIDARSAQRFTGKDKVTDPVPGHIPGAYSRPFSDNLDASGMFKLPSELAERFNRISGHDVVNMCGSGVTGTHNILARRVAGLGDGRLYAGSWSEWIRDPKHPVEVGPGRGL